MTPQLGGVNGTTISASRYYEDIIIPTTTDNLKFQADSAYAGYVDIVSVRKILGFSGNGWDFDGATQYITVLDFLDTGNSATEISVLFWAMPRSKMSTSGCNPFSKFNSSPNQEWNFVQTRTIWQSNIWKTGVTAEGRKSYTSSFPIPINNPALFGFTHKAGALSLYLNGVLDPNPTKGTDTDVSTIADTPTDILLGGGYSAGVPTNFFGGYMFEAIIFNRGLSTQEHRDFFEMTRSRYGV